MTGHHAERRSSAFRYRAGLVAAVLLASGGSAACGDDGTDKADRAVKTFLVAWHDGRLGTVTLLDRAGQPLAGDTAQTQLTALEGPLAVRRPGLTRKGKPHVRENTATATVEVAWPVTDAATWTYSTTVRLAKRDGRWIPMFSPDTIHPDLSSASALTLKKSTPVERGGILDGAGQPIVSNLPVVVVGVEPRRVTNQSVLVGVLKSIFAEIGVTVDLDSLPARLKSATPEAFVEIVTLRRPAYEQVRQSLRDLAGTVFRETVQPLAPTRVFARALLGQVGEVTKEILDKNPGKFQVGDQVGLSGLQARYEDRLRGTTGVTVRDGDKTLFEQAPATGLAVRTTLDQRVQNAADGALAGESRHAALVAIRVSDGAVLAVANGPDGGQVNLAFTAQVPPGSTAKMITTLGLLDAGAVALDTPVDCPATLTVEGRTFKNAHDMAIANPPFRTDFARSCNTAFVSLAPKLGDDGLATAARSVGVGVPWSLGDDVFTGKVSQGGSAAERAAAAFGQGTTVVSPVALAGAAAAIARGTWKQPLLITDPAPAQPAQDGAAIKQTSLDQLRTMMREVVTSGTASSLKGLPGEPLYGKTGTAEFDDSDPTRTHSWFIGWKGDLAFAVFVENGGDSTDSAVPMAGKFFLALGQ